MRKAFFLICLLGLCCRATGQPIVWDGTHDFQSIGKQVSLLEDPAGRLTIEQVSAAPWSGRFTPSKKTILGFGFTESVYWIRFSVKNLTTQPLWLEVAQTHLPITDLYFQDQAGHWHVSKAGYKVNLEHKPVKHLFQVFPLPQRTDTLYVRLISNSPPVPLKLWNRQAFEIKATKQTIFYGLYVGILLFVIINNLFLFFSLRRFVYLHYCLLVLVYIFIAACVMDGFIVYFFPDTDLMYWYLFLPIINMIVSISYGLVFLEVKKYSPGLYRIGVGFFFYCLAYAVWYRFLPIIVIEPLNSLMALIALGLPVVMGIKTGRKGNKIGYYYTVAYGLFFLIVVAETIYIQTGKPTYFFEISHVAYANLLEVLVLAYALSKRFEWERRDIEKARSDAQQRLLEQTRENERLLLSQNETLEQEVAARTNDIRHQAVALQQSLDTLKATQAQLIHREKMASLGELTAGIAHEIQNPLNFVNNFAEINTELTDELTEYAEAGDLTAIVNLSADLRQNMTLITRNGQRASSIVQSMLEHSQISASGRQLTDFRGLVEEYLKLAYHTIRTKDSTFAVELITDYDPTLPRLELAPQEIVRVLLNLFNNAFYAVWQRKNEKNEPGYHPSIRVRTRYQAPMLELWVRDNGTGIPASIRDKIFQPFFTTKPAGEGTGLGLSLSYDIITRSYDGEIRVESVEGEFTEFYVSLKAELSSYLAQMADKR